MIQIGKSIILIQNILIRFLKIIDVQNQLAISFVTALL